MSPKSKRNEKLFSANEAAEYVGVSRTTITRYLISGYLPSHQGKDGHYVIKQSDLDNLRENRPSLGRPVSDVTRGQKIVKLGEDAYKKVSILSIQQGRSKEEVMSELIEQAYAASLKHLKAL